MSPNDGPTGCWICESPDVSYVDVLGFGWCLDHYEEWYLGGHEGEKDA